MFGYHYLDVNHASFFENRMCTYYNKGNFPERNFIKLIPAFFPDTKYIIKSKLNFREISIYHALLIVLVTL